MEPVVNGLEGNYSEQVQVRRLDANSSEGSDAFRHYQLLGHPSYVLLNPRGVVMWKGLGEISKVELEGQIQTALEDS
jgi:hypothetical protein